MHNTQLAKTLIQLESAKVVIRQNRCEDAPRLLEMHARISSDSICYQYLGVYKPTLNDLRQLERIHGCGWSIFVAAMKNTQERVIGIAYFVLGPTIMAKTQTNQQRPSGPFLSKTRFRARVMGTCSYTA